MKANALIIAENVIKTHVPGTSNYLGNSMLLYELEKNPNLKHNELFKTALNISAPKDKFGGKKKSKKSRKSRKSRKTRKSRK